MKVIRPMRGSGGEQDLPPTRIGVLMGGLSREREVSLRTGAAISKALKGLGYTVVEIDVGRDVATVLAREKVEVAFIALHGRYGEDGCIQGLLEVLGIPYTGTGVLASAICLDKDLTKRLVAPLGIPLPRWSMIRRGEAVVASPLPLPVIVKPNQEGSTIGMTIVRLAGDFLPALQTALAHDGKVLVEEFITGTEVTVAVLDGRALPPLEIVPKSGTYDYQSKYTKGMTDYIVPARISEDMTQKVCAFSEAVFRHLELAGVARMDFMISDRPYFLEVNTVPGMTETSLVPKMAAAAGIGFERLCETILGSASLHAGGEAP